MRKIIFIVLIFLILIFAITLLLGNKVKSPLSSIKKRVSINPSSTTEKSNDPLAINYMQRVRYPGSNIMIVHILSSGTNYYRYLTSYQSDNLTIYALLTVPEGAKPEGGWPVIVFNHGYIPPSQYSTTSSYSVMIDPLAAAGCIVFVPDYRGNNDSQGVAQQPYVSPDDVTDSMNAIASIKHYKDANPNKIAVVGHSMGGNVTLHELVISHDIKAAAILSGVVGNENDLLKWWNYRYSAHIISGNDLDTYYSLQNMIKERGSLNKNPDYWNSIDPTKFLQNIDIPIQIQIGTADDQVPISFSLSLRDTLQSEGKTVDFHQYPDANHNLSPDITTAKQQVISFFKQYLN